MKYESLIFDIDGTLWDSRGLVAEGYNIQLKAEGLEHLFVNAVSCYSTATDLTRFLCLSTAQPRLNAM